MDVREKLVKLLKKAICGEIIEDREKAFNAIADHLIAHGVTVQEWISFSKRQPTEKDATDDGYIFVCREDNGQMKTEISLLDVVFAYPDLYDYWMVTKMPQPPKGE